jgi:hypothetical protein
MAMSLDALPASERFAENSSCIQHSFLNKLNPILIIKIQQENASSYQISTRLEHHLSKQPLVPLLSCSLPNHLIHSSYFQRSYLRAVHVVPESEIGGHAERECLIESASVLFVTQQPCVAQSVEAVFACIIHLSSQLNKFK